MKSLFIVLTTVFIILLYSLLNYNNLNNIQKHLDKETKQFNIIYHTLYEEFKSKSQLIFDLMLDDKEIINIYKNVDLIIKKDQPDLCNQKLYEEKAKLYTLLKNKYNKIKENGRTPTITFHTKNNLSFLNMENLKHFCYDLTPTRPLVVKINDLHQAIDGFEIGKAASMFRFLFPIMDKNLYLGSVEISFDSLIFIKEFSKHSNVLAQIHVSKEVVDNKFVDDSVQKKYYKSSPLKGMYTINSHITNLEEKTKKEYKKVMTSLPSREKILETIALHNTSFSIYDKIKGDSITVIPIRNSASNKEVAYLTTKHFSHHLKKENNYFYTQFFIIGFFLILVMFLVYKYFAGKIKRTKLLKQKNKELAKKQSKLEKVNTNLEEIVVKKINENLKQKELISKQSKIAALGEMMDAIAHQWKQPLNIIGMTINNLVVKVEFNEKISKKDIVNLGKDTDLQIDHLITTIDEFRKFFRPNQPTTRCRVKEVINSALNLEKDYLIKNQIDLVQDIDEELEFNCIKTEFIHVIINIINNSIDAFNERKIDNRIIKLTANTIDENVIIEICDNAGGIKQDILPHIFKSNYTTKETLKATGIGLYLAKQIIEKIDGSIEAYNKEDGVCFRILL